MASGQLDRSADEAGSARRPERIPDVFISHKREERQRCIAIRNKLVALKLDVWFDAQVEPGTSFDEEIERAVRAARAVVVLWSPLAVQSDWVRGEAMVGQEREVLCAAFIEVARLPVAFKTIQTADLTTRDFADDDEQWLSVLRRIGDLVGRPGLADYSAILASPTADRFAEWARRWSTDPLAVEPSGARKAANDVRRDALPAVGVA